jgi:hypothetical protein
MSVTAWIGTAAAIIGIIGGIIGIAKACEDDPPPKGPATFTGELNSPTSADKFVSLANANDGKVVRLNVTCRYGGLVCEGNSRPSLTGEDALLPVFTRTGRYYFHIYTEGSDATANNGSYGAGSLVVKGYFTVNVQGELGSEGRGIQNVDLHGVSAAQVNN